MKIILAVNLLWISWNLSLQVEEFESDNFLNTIKKLKARVFIYLIFLYWKTAPLNKNKDGCALQDTSTNAATFSSESSAGFSSGCPSPYGPEGFTSSQVTFPSSSMQTLQYINGNGW